MAGRCVSSASFMAAPVDSGEEPGPEPIATAVRGRAPSIIAGLISTHEERQHQDHTDQRPTQDAHGDPPQSLPGPGFFSAFGEHTRSRGRLQHGATEQDEGQEEHPGCPARPGSHPDQIDTITTSSTTTITPTVEDPVDQGHREPGRARRSAHRARRLEAWPKAVFLPGSAASRERRLNLPPPRRVRRSTECRQQQQQQHAQHAATSPLASRPHQSPLEADETGA